MLTEVDIKPMIEHWLGTPPNGYYGLSYGADKMPLLMQPLSKPVADRFLAKLKEDISILQKLSGNQLYLYSENIGFEKKMIYIVLGETLIEVGQSQQQNIATGGTFDANAK